MFNLQPLPLREETLCRFIAYLAHSSLSIRLYLSAIRFLQISQGLPDPSLSSIPRLDYVLKGIWRSPTHSRPRHLPITPGILRTIHNVWSPTHPLKNKVPPYYSRYPPYHPQCVVTDPLKTKAPPYYSRHPPYHPQCVVAYPPTQDQGASLLLQASSVPSTMCGRRPLSTSTRSCYGRHVVWAFMDS